MTDFQKEVGCLIVLLAFLLGCLGFAEIVHTETTAKSWTMTQKKAVQNDGSKDFDLADLHCF